MFIFCFYNPGSPFSAALSESPCCGTERLKQIRPVPNLGTACAARQGELLNSSLPAGIAPGGFALLSSLQMHGSEHPRRAVGCSTISSSSPLLHQHLSVNLCSFSFFSVAPRCLQLSTMQPQQQDPNRLGLMRSHQQKRMWGPDRGAPWFSSH